MSVKHRGGGTLCHPARAVCAGGLGPARAVCAGIGLTGQVMQGGAPCSCLQLRRSYAWCMWTMGCD